MAHFLSTPPAVHQAGPNQPDLDTEEVWRARVDLAACFRMAASYDMEEGICNHFSAMVPGYDDLFIVNPHGYAFCELTASMLLVCDFHGNVVSGAGAPEATAFYIHARIHKNVPRTRAAFHTHMPYATALSMTEGDPLIFAGQTALKFYGRTAVDRDYNGLALDEREGDPHRVHDRRRRHRVHEASRRHGLRSKHRRGLGRPLLSRARMPGADPGSVHRSRRLSGLSKSRRGGIPTDAHRRSGISPPSSRVDQANPRQDAAGLQKLTGTTGGV
jgi:ribulose-5-phosphate 4-epimerase/fuculose-1-phosphate aldolase